MEEIIPKGRVEKLKSYLNKLKVELVMSNYTNGWYKNWVVEKIKSVKEKIKEYEK